MSTPAHILVVEDDPVITDLIEQLLRAEGYVVTHVADCRAAVTVAHEQAIDLILMDLILPVMSGIEASHTIKASRTDQASTDQAVALVPIVAMSAGVDLRATAHQLPVEGMLAKPIDIDELVATVHLCLHHASPNA